MRADALFSMEGGMNSIIWSRTTAGFLGVILMVMAALSGPAAAQEPIPQILKQGCAKELNTYCKTVSPGEGRVVACLYSRNDKLSVDCAFAMYDASEEYEQVMAALRHIARKTACRSDIAQYCKDVPQGGGRIYECITKNKATLTDGCRAALPKAEGLLKEAGIIQ
jgi:hypothetical protein